MKYSVDVFDTEVWELLNDLTQITGIEPWMRRFEWIQREASENPYMEEWLCERCLIEMSFHNVLQSRRLVRHRPFRVDGMLDYELVAFAAGATRCYKQLSERGKRRLRGILLDGLKEDKGLSSIQHEFSTAAHLMSRGFDVEFHDLETGGGFDFLARNGEIEIEVECKMFSADLGRKFHRRSSARLCKALEGVLAQTHASASVGLIVTVTVPDRLTACPDQHSGIERALMAGILSGDALTQSEYCAVRVQDFSIEDSPFTASPEDLSSLELRNFMAAHTGEVDSTLIVAFSPGKRAVIQGWSMKTRSRSWVYDVGL